MKSRPDTDFNIVIPARYESTRFPGKPLAKLAGKALVLHAYDCACLAGAQQVVVATDSAKVARVCEQAGADVCMTATTHATGTDRIAEVVQQRNWHDEQIVVNVQGDEPMLPAQAILQVATNLAEHGDASIATLAAPILDAHDITDPNVVKVVFDRVGYALYFSRATIPHQRDGQRLAGSAASYFRHIGLYAFKTAFLRRFSSLPESPLERDEKLEQLRALWHGERIHVDLAAQLPGPGVDTQQQLDEVEAMMTTGGSRA